MNWYRRRHLWFNKHAFVRYTTCYIRVYTRSSEKLHRFFFFGGTVERFNAFLIDLHAPNKFLLSQIAKRLITTFRVGERHDLSCKCVRGVFFLPSSFRLPTPKLTVPGKLHPEIIISLFRNLQMPWTHLWHWRHLHLLLLLGDREK